MLKLTMGIMSEDCGDFSLSAQVGAKSKSSSMPSDASATL